MDAGNAGSNPARDIPSTVVAYTPGILETPGGRDYMPVLPAVDGAGESVRITVTAKADWFDSNTCNPERDAGVHSSSPVR